MLNFLDRVPHLNTLTATITRGRLRMFTWLFSFAVPPHTRLSPAASCDLSGTGERWASGARLAGLAISPPAAQP